MATILGHSLRDVALETTHHRIKKRRGARRSHSRIECDRSVEARLCCLKNKERVYPRRDLVEPGIDPGHLIRHYPSLHSRSVVTTGGASGIGRAMVEGFLAQGAKVAFLDKDKRAGEVTLGDTQYQDRVVEFIPCDVTDVAALKKVVARAERALKGLHVLIANAANDTRHTVDEMTSELWDDCRAINLKHRFFAAQAAYPAIAAAGGGSIICLGSISWLNNTTGMIDPWAGAHSCTSAWAYEDSSQRATTRLDDDGAATAQLD